MERRGVLEKMAWNDLETPLAAPPEWPTGHFWAYVSDQASILGLSRQRPCGRQAARKARLAWEGARLPVWGAAPPPLLLSLLSCCLSRGCLMMGREGGRGFHSRGATPEKAFALAAAGTPTLPCFCA